MGQKVRSARGVSVDFELLRIKEQIGATPEASTVKAREDFIDNKLRRRIKRLASLSNNQAATVISNDAAMLPSTSESDVDAVEQDVEQVDVTVDTELSITDALPTKKIIKDPSATE